jgi:hypothetical protein
MGIYYQPIIDDAPIARLALATRPDESSSVVLNFAAIVAARRL